MAYIRWAADRKAQWPASLSPDEFATIFPAESDVVEFKQGLSSLQDSIVAFSNTRGGLILTGVRNDGRPTGLPYTPQVEDKIRDEAAHTHSHAPIAIGGLTIGGVEITVISVGHLREGFAQTSNGRVLVRVGTRRPALIGGDLIAFMHDRARSSFESVVTDVSLDHAADHLVETLALQLGIARGGRQLERLAERGLLELRADRWMLTVAGCLYLLERPDRALGKSYIEIMRFPAGASDFDRREEFTGPLPQQVIDATTSVMSHLGTDSVVLGVRRHDLPRLPERVVREAIANAVAHRSYEQRGTAVRVALRSDRVEIVSPGGLVPPVTVETMRNAYAARNNNVIRVLRRFALAEDSGKGVDLMQDLMRDELLAEPDFSATDSTVTVSRPVLSGTRPEERAWVREVVERGQIEDRDRVLLVHARRGEVLTNQRARELLRTGRDGAGAALRRLVDAGLLTREGERGGTKYQLASRLAPPAGLRLSRAELRDLVVEMAAEGSVTNRDVRNRTGLERQDVLLLFDELVGTGALLRIGQRRWTRYVTPGGTDQR